MIRPLAVQSFLDAVVSSEEARSLHLQSAMLSIIETGQIYAVSATRVQAVAQPEFSSTPTALTGRPLPRFKALLFPLGEPNTAHFERNAEISSIAARAWTEVASPRKPKKASAKYAVPNQSDAAILPTPSYLSLRNKDHGLIHVRAIVPTRTASMVSPSLHAVDEDESAFALGEQNHSAATVLLILHCALKDDAEATQPQIHALGSHLASVLAPVFSSILR